jgi:hypothetical protein
MHFFHHTTMNRWNHNKNLFLIDAQGNIVDDHTDIEKELMNYFSDLLIELVEDKRHPLTIPPTYTQYGL